MDFYVKSIAGDPMTAMKNLEKAFKSARNSARSKNR